MYVFIPLKFMSQKAYTVQMSPNFVVRSLLKSSATTTPLVTSFRSISLAFLPHNLWILKLVRHSSLGTRLTRLSNSITASSVTNQLLANPAYIVFMSLQPPPLCLCHLGQIFKMYSSRSSSNKDHPTIHAIVQITISCGYLRSNSCMESGDA